MPQPLDPATYVHQGFWINWTKGKTQGLTLTLSPVNANVLIAMLALFVTTSGGQLWTIIQFTLHQIRASDGSRSSSMLHHQQQVVLRNTSTDLATARRLCNLAWSWRKKAVKSFRSSMAAVLLAVVHFVFMMIIGALSASIAGTGQAVLLRSPYCGIWNETYFEIAGNGINPTTDGTFALSLEFISKKVHDVQLSLGYAQECYMSQASYSMFSSCSTFQQSRLNWTTLRTEPCHFGSLACAEGSKTIMFDTGLIDSHNDLGINANYNDRLGYRRVTNCAVLNDTAYTTNWEDQNYLTDAQQSMKTAKAYYGRSLLEQTEWTYTYSNFADVYTNFSGQVTSPYQVDSQIAYGESPNPSISTFEPLSEYKQPYADLVLLFLSYNGRYIGPVDDPWFSAHQVQLTNSRAAIAAKTYVRDRPITTVGCTEQHQVCTTGRKCTSLLGFDQVQDSVMSKFNLTTNQNVTLDRIMRAVTASSMREVIEGLKISNAPMLAINLTATASSTLSLVPPPHQWELEADYWYSIAMAQLQRTIVEYGTGQIAANTKYILPPATNGDRWFCQNLMIQGTAFQSFSVLALTLVLVVGTLIVVLSLTIEALASYIQKRLNRGSAGMKIWDDHDMLGPQLWRRRFEQQLPSQNDSFATIDEKFGLTDHKCMEKVSTPDPDVHHILPALGLANYLEDVMPGS